ncbi:MAG TPA: NAD(P)/FAD-dependent oxidoreductase [Chloroflexota bacterium]|nr:NAD(P)/FAD-dependent oxidoreductase [Chloroflexota bacterium]
MSRAAYDAVVVGAGPNGLAAAIVLAKAGRSVLVREASSTAGGGVRSDALTLPGFVHDVCSAIHPLGLASPLFRRLPLDAHGLEWVHPPIPLAHPLDDGSAVLLHQSTSATAAGLGRDGAAWRLLMDPFVSRFEQLAPDLLAPLRPPRHPFLLARFGMLAVQPSSVLTRLLFREPRARALFTGLAGHATLPLTHPPSAAFGLVLGMTGHAVGWPMPRGGAQRIADALVSYLRSLGGEIETNAPVEAIDDLPAHRAVLLDLTPRQVLRIAGSRLTEGYRKELEAFQYGLGTFKVDWALDGPIPWRSPDAARAGTVHLGGTIEEMEQARKEEWAGRPAERPLVLLSQPTLFDPSRAPEGKHTAWGYCHLPNGSPVDMTERIEAQVERFAPGFRDRIIARHTMGPADFERHNPNLVGGDLNGGEATLRQLFFRPALRPVPYATSAPDIFICSSSTPPGGGVHGMCGFHAARTALRRLF